MDLPKIIEMAARFGATLLKREPIYSQIVVTRRCNLSCGYCSEYDQVSPPVPLAVLKERIDALHRLRTFHICMLGGEPLLHPELAPLVRHAARHSQVSITTNGFLLTDEMIGGLNDAGLFSMQVSVDALTPDKNLYIQKALKTVAGKLERLRQRAAFRVFVNVVLCEQSKRDFKQMVDVIQDLGFPMTVGLVHDEQGKVATSGDDYQELYNYYYEKLGSSNPIGFDYNMSLLRGERPEWKCRAGSRYLYVDEHGDVQLCPMQPGRINKPITEYTVEDAKEHYSTYKGCESGCSVMCAYRPSAIDNEPVKILRNVVRNLARG